MFLIAQCCCLDYCQEFKCLVRLSEVLRTLTPLPKTRNVKHTHLRPKLQVVSGTVTSLCCGWSWAGVGGGEERRQPGRSKNKRRGETVCKEGVCGAPVVAGLSLGPAGRPVGRVGPVEEEWVEPWEKRGPSSLSLDAGQRASCLLVRSLTPEPRALGPRWKAGVSESRKSTHLNSENVWTLNQIILSFWAVAVTSLK